MWKLLIFNVWKFLKPILITKQNLQITRSQTVCYLDWTSKLWQKYGRISKLEKQPKSKNIQG